MKVIHLNINTKTISVFAKKKKKRIIIAQGRVEEAFKTRS